MDDAYSIKKATIINASGKYITVILQLLVNAFLSRILSPDDYGIVAVITVFSTFFISLSDMGFGAAVVQRKDLNKEDTDRIFTFTLFVALVLSFIFFGLSFGIANFYDNPVYVPLGLILSFSLFFNALNMVPNGIMNKEKKFLGIALRTFVAYAVAAGLAIVVALHGLRYYAIALQTVLSSVIIFLWNYVETKPRIHIEGFMKSVKKVLSYSGFQFAFNIINYISRNLDNLLTGKIMGSDALGFYYKAYNLMLYPVNNLTGVISPVLHPILSKYQNQRNVIYQKYVSIFKKMFVVAGYVAPFCYFAADEIVSILYGSQWNNSIHCFKILSFAILPQIVGCFSGSIYQSLGKTRLLFINGVINTIITVIAILSGVFIGGSISELSICVTVAFNIHFLITHYMLICIGFHYKIFRFFKNFILDFIIYIACMIIVVLFPNNFYYGNIFSRFVFKIFFLGIIYILILFFTGEYKSMIKILKKR